MADPDESAADRPEDELVLRWQELREQEREVSPRGLSSCKPELAES